MPQNEDLVAEERRSGAPSIPARGHHDCAAVRALAAITVGLWLGGATAAAAEGPRATPRHPRLNVKTLAACLKDQEPLTRDWAARRLGDLGDAQAVPYLIEALRDKLEIVQIAALISLGQLKDPRATEPVMEMLKSEMWQVRRQAILTLGSIGDKRALVPLLTLAAQGSPTVARGEMPDAIAAIGNRVMSFETIASLAKLGHEPSVVTVLKQAEAGEGLARTDAVHALDGVNDARASVLLVRLLSDRDADLRASAADVGARKGDPAFIEPIEAALAKEADGSTKASMAKALAVLGDAKALFAGLKDPNARMREGCALRLQQNPDRPAAIAALREALADEGDARTKGAMRSAIDLLESGVDLDALNDARYLGPVQDPPRKP